MVFIYKRLNNKLELFQTIYCPDTLNGTEFGLGVLMKEGFLFIGYTARVEEPGRAGKFVNAVEVYKLEAEGYVRRQTLYPDKPNTTYFGR